MHINVSLNQKLQSANVYFVGRIKIDENATLWSLCI